MIIITNLPKSILFILFDFIPLADLGRFLTTFSLKIYQRKEFVDQAYRAKLSTLTFSILGNRELNNSEICKKPLKIQFEFFQEWTIRKSIEPELITAFSAAKNISERIKEQKGADEIFRARIDEEGLLTAASAFGRCDIVKQFLELGAEPGTFLPASIRFYTPLIIATQFGFDDVVRQLLQAKASLDAGINFDLSPLILAVEKGHNSIIKLLVENKADLNAPDKRGHTAWSVAIKTRQISTIETLISFKKIPSYLQGQYDKLYSTMKR